MPTALDVHTQLWGLLDIDHVTCYDGEVPDTPPSDPTTQRVKAYAVLYDSPGRLSALTMLGTQDSLDSTFQVTCVAGDPTTVLWCADKVRAALVGATVTLDGDDYQVRAADVDPGPVRRDDDVRPPRHWFPLLFTLFIP